MSEKFENGVVARYVLNILTSRKSFQVNPLETLVEWLEDEGADLGLVPAGVCLRDDVEQIREVWRGRDIAPRAIRKIFSTTLEHLSGICEATQGKGPSRLEKNLRLLAAELGLDEIERDLLGLAVRYQVSSEVENLCDSFSRRKRNTHTFCALMLGTSMQQIAEKLRPGARLIGSGLIELTGNSIHELLSVPESVLHGLRSAQGDLGSLRSQIIGPVSAPQLPWEAFSYLMPAAGQAANFLKEAARGGLSGVNILIYGPPGTGKTEFCKTLCAHLGLDLFSVGEADEDGDEPDRRDRLNSYRLSQNLLRYQRGSVLLFDEMDDLVAGGASPFLPRRVRTGSKIFLNRLLENNPVPTLWIINDVTLLEAPLVRRMALALEMKTPPRAARQQVWERLLASGGVDLSPEDLTELAAQDVPPAVVEGAIRFAKLAGGSSDDVRFAARSLVKAINGGRMLAPKDKDLEVFAPDLSHADLDLDHLTARLCRPDAARNVSLCLHGPPGTGKTAYVRYLAEAMGLEVLVKRASDLFSPYVGASEQNIAAAFNEARDKQAFLVFDEADSLLGDRRYAQRSWEISQVNEMLTWMESHPLPFACTTNLMDRLDAASLRRFTFKVGFDYLRPSQCEQAFELFFGQPAPASLRDLTVLTPGDFAVVRKKAQVLACTQDPAELIAMLTQECQVKGPSQRPMGFAC